MHSPKNLLGLHCMHNSFHEPRPIPMSERMSKFFPLKPNSESEFKFVSSNFHIPWLSFESILKYSKSWVRNYLIQILDQFLDFYLWESSKTFIQIQISFLHTFKPATKNSQTIFLFHPSFQPTKPSSHLLSLWFLQQNFWPIAPASPT
jgi:hypothetical protein